MGDRLPAVRPARFVTSHSGQLSLLPSAGRKTSTVPAKVQLRSAAGESLQVRFIPLVDKRVRGR